jgi:hypothetical protein
VQSLNTIADRPIDVPRLRRAFDGQWPQLQDSIRTIKLDATTPIRRTQEDLLDEILQHVRIFATGALGEHRTDSGPRPSTFRSKLPEGQERRYEQNLVGRIYRTLLGTFEWSVEDTKNKVVVADGGATTLPEAQRQADAAAAMRPLGNWQLMTR